jgi:hypothetical protein
MFVVEPQPTPARPVAQPSALCDVGSLLLPLRAVMAEAAQANPMAETMRRREVIFVFPGKGGGRFVYDVNIKWIVFLSFISELKQTCRHLFLRRKSFVESFRLEISTVISSA